MTKKRLKVAVYTATRAEYGLLRPLLGKINTHPVMELHLIVSGTHFLEQFGATFDEILEDDWPIVHAMDLSKEGCTPPPEVTLSQTIERLSAILKEIAPNVMVVMGDRFELLAVAACCTTLRVPIAHISGGEITEGAFDDQVRHALTKLAHIHFVASNLFQRRVLQMGEEDWRVVISGEPGLDGIYGERLPLTQLEAELGIKLGAGSAIVTLHPTTQEADELPHQLSLFITSLRKAGLRYLITYPNMDPGHELIISAMKDFVATYREAVFVPSLGSRKYYTALENVDVMIGNSSSGLVEAPSLGVPVINVGSRQDGRPRAANVFDCPFEEANLLDAISSISDFGRKSVDNPFFVEDSAARVCEGLADLLLNRTNLQVLRKKFVDVTAL